MADLALKYRKKTVRDICLSNDIGRDSPFDPFKDRSVTKFMTKPNTFVSDRMYFAERPGRRVPCGVDYNRLPHQPNVPVSKLLELDEGGMGTAMRREDEVLNDRGYAKPPGVQDVSFTKSARFNAKQPNRNHVQLRKELMEERENNVILEKYGVGEVKNIVEKFDHTRAPGFGVPKPRLEYSLLQKGQTKFTQFEFEKKKPEEAKTTAVLDAHTFPRNLYGLDDDAEGEGGEDEETLDEFRANATAQSRAALASANDAQEVWDAKRKEALSKHGLITGNRKELLRAKAIAKRSETVRGIADFSALASRDAPMGFQLRGKEMHDLLYAPSYVATTRELKKYADVRIGKYAPRTAHTTVLKDNVDKLLTIENLSRFYKSQLEKERKSVFVTPDQAAEVSQQNVSLPTQSSTMANSAQLNNTSSGQFFSAFDDFSLHPPTPPKGSQTRKFTKTPDLSVYADRYDEPLASVVGGDVQKRERLARLALRREGLL